MLECAKDGQAVPLTFTPNLTCPDTVYYNSYTHPYMGWRINIINDFNQGTFRPSGAGKTVVQYFPIYVVLTIVMVVFMS